MQLEGKVAHVTGAGAGIGRAIALRLARGGAAVAVSDVDGKGGVETVARIEAAGGRAAFFRADVSVEDDVAAMIHDTEEVFGGLDLLVNNAGGAPEPYFPEAEPAHWMHQVGVNLLGVMLGTWYGIAALRRRGGGALSTSPPQPASASARTPRPSMRRARRASGASRPRSPSSRGKASA
jgi:NAD(P)-dependent dehydrogenase (short-subunit alcohol dehydrogenase family)